MYVSITCFDIDIAPPKLGLRRLFRRPYRGSICVIEIIGAELTPIANSGTARSLYLSPPQLAPVAALHHFGRAAEPAAPKARYEAQMKPPARESTLRHAGGLDWRSPFGLLSKGMPDLRVEWKHGSASGDTQVEDVALTLTLTNPNPN